MLLNSSILINGDIKRISAKSEDNGVIGSYDTLNIGEARHYENFISVNFFGDVFYHSYLASVEMKVHVLKFKKCKELDFKEVEFTGYSGLYISSCIKNILRGKFGYGNQLSSSKLRDEKFEIFLPTLGGKINFSFMEKFIEELDAYLAATGLRDYKLTDKEQAALVEFEEFSQMGSASGFENVKVGDLFTVKSNPQLNKDSFKFCDNGEYPYFTRTVLNNGIAGYVEYLDDTHKIAGNSLAVGMLGMQFFYMDKDFYAGQFTKTLFAKFDKFSQVAAQYFIVWLNKNQKIYQGGLVRDFEKLLNATEISIPIKNGEIDYDFIANFLKAIEKLVIKDVVLWANKKIEATKKVISKI